MPRRAKPPRLWFRPEKRKTGRVVRSGVWVILDRGKQISTGCGKGEDVEAEKAFQRWLGEKHTPARKQRDISQIRVADVISIYLDDVAPKRANPDKIAARMDRLLDFCGGEMVLDEVDGAWCRKYVEHRKRARLKVLRARKAIDSNGPALIDLTAGDGGARRDLEDLRAAIQHHARQGLHRSIVNVALPDKGLSRDRWLRREEAAKLLITSWRAREKQKVSRGARKGQMIVTRKRPLHHIARFTLIGVYTGTRAASIAAASFYPGAGRSFVDVESGLFYRLPRGRRKTKKRQPPVRLPDRLLAHMRRWKRLEEARAAAEAREPARHVVEFNGKPVVSVKTGFATAVRLAGLDETEGRVTPHTLRHTAVTWKLQAGIPISDVAGFFGMSAKMVEEVYGHHHPDFQREAANAAGGRRAANVVSLFSRVKGNA